GQFGIVDKKLIKATILPSLLLGHYPDIMSGRGTAIFVGRVHQEYLPIIDNIKNSPRPGYYD
ncbi:hypothetical protein, partial [Microcoleus sp. Pol12B4]|uniref:hypothetical protein n=1 Tax=Microcoleus sp. Pol12B4 TaxID=3055395 RepID=UPI002FD575A2